MKMFFIFTGESGVGKTAASRVIVTDGQEFPNNYTIVRRDHSIPLSQNLFPFQKIGKFSLHNEKKK